MDGTDAIADLERALDHAFCDRALLIEALRHASVAQHRRHRGASYQRLEFLGDRVLGLVIASILFERFPGAPEGELARRMNHLVRREACADRAKALGIDRALLLGAAEDEAGGRQKAAILADACEAVIAAVYLDAGFEAAAAVVKRAWTPLLDGHMTAERDPKTHLQERLQAQRISPPIYRVIARSGPDHAPTFVVVAEADGTSIGTGRGTSKREAEQNAARDALIAMDDPGE